MALNSRVLSKNDKNEDVSNAKDMGMMSNNTNLAQILATSVNGFLLDYFKEYAHRACLFAFCAVQTDRTDAIAGTSRTAGEPATWSCTQLVLAISSSPPSLSGACVAFDSGRDGVHPRVPR